MEIILASANPDKITEIKTILQDNRLSFRTMRAAGFSEDIEENGHSYEENAMIKARTVHQRTGGWVLADDSGLSVNVLDGAPGIYSARFAGVQASYPDKIACLQAMLNPWPQDQWQASFVCVLALITPEGKSFIVRGECHGLIAREARGQNGFGYDPIFWLPDRQGTMAELTDTEKNARSHRGLALRKLVDLMESEHLLA